MLIPVSCHSVFLAIYNALAGLKPTSLIGLATESKNQTYFVCFPFSIEIISRSAAHTDLEFTVLNVGITGVHHLVWLKYLQYLHCITVLSNPLINEPCSETVTLVSINVYLTSPALISLFNLNGTLPSVQLKINYPRTIATLRSRKC